MIDLLQLVIYGVVFGSILALGAIGVSLTFGILRFANFSHGDLMTLGAYFALPLVTLLALPVLVALPLACALTALAAILIDRLLYRNLRRRNPVILLIASFGVALILRSLIQIVFGPDNQVYASGIQLPWRIGELRIKPDQVLILAGTALLVTALHLFLSRTRWGKAMRAMADDVDLARISGIDTERVVLWTWVIGGVLACAAGVFLAMDTRLHPVMGWRILLSVFAAAILGGIGKPYGAVVGGLVIGVAEETSTLILEPAYKSATAFMILVVMLVVRPTGLFGGALMEVTGLLAYAVFFLTIAGIYAVLALGLNMQWGWTGIFNIGVGAFFAVGAYASAIVTAPPSPDHLGGFGLPFVLGAAVAMVLAGLLAAVIGLITLNLRTDYLAIATIGIAEIVRLGLKNEAWLTNGVRGIAGIPRPLDGLVPGADGVFYLGLVIVVVGLVYLVLERAHRAPFGRVLRGIRENEPAVMAAGKNVLAFRLQAFAVGSAVMGLAGALYAHFVTFISPEAFLPEFATFLVWVMLIAGGSGNNRGAILGAFGIWAVWSGTEFVTGQLPDDWVTRAGALRVLLIGVLLEVILLTRPEGLLPERPPRPIDDDGGRDPDQGAPGSRPTP